MRLPALFDGLVFRIGLLLTVALVPIGLIAISQTRQLVAEEQRRTENAILALTAEAAAGEESTMRAGSTVAEALASSVPLLRNDPAACDGLFKAFVEDNGQYSFAGYVDRNGTVRCGSDGSGTDRSTGEVFQRMRADPSPRIDLVFGAISGMSVIVMTDPLFDDSGSFDGYVAVSLPNRQAFRSFERVSADRPVDLITFNDEGKILSAEKGMDNITARLPRGMELADFANRPRFSFTGFTREGEKRVFAVVPVIPGLVFALGSWPVEQIAPGSSGWMLASPFLFPALMWLASLTVAYLAVHRLAIRNIARLRRRMAEFTTSRRFHRPQSGLAVPLEFRQIEQTWADMAETVVREEAELENIIHARTVLLKEVHHRVKNNLQLIASIVSMKIRKATSPEARAALKEVQMRVMSIATVHRALYTTSTVGKVQADELLSEIIAKTVEGVALPASTVRIETGYVPVSLYPDQAVPLSLLASEAMTNALKYVGKPADGSQPWIRVALGRGEAEAAELVVENSVGTPLNAPDGNRGTGLGANLIQAFARQMRGTIDPETELPDRYRIRLQFPIVGFEQAPQEAALSEEV